MKDALSDHRKQVKAIDKEIFRLVAKRIEHVKAIGKIKHDNDMPIKDYRVEKDVIERGREAASEFGLDGDFAETLSQALIHYSVNVQDEFHRKWAAPQNTNQRHILVIGGQGNMGMWMSDYFASFGHKISHYETAPTQGRYPVAQDFDEAAKAADVIVICTPISVTSSVIQKLVFTGTNALVFDICSLKTPLIGPIRAAAKKGLRISSVHPMFGPDVQVLTGRNIVLLETDDLDLTDQIQELFADTTAEIIRLPLEKHDELISHVLGLSHLSNMLFASVLKKSKIAYGELATVASTTFNAQIGVVRSVIEENIEMYYEIQSENGFTASLLKDFMDVLSSYRDLILGKERQSFCQELEECREYLGSVQK